MTCGLLINFLLHRNDIHDYYVPQIFTVVNTSLIPDSPCLKGLYRDQSLLPPCGLFVMINNY